MLDRSQLRRGLDVFDSNGSKIGSISNVGPDYVEVPTGFLGLGRDLFVPFSAFDRADDQGAYLNVSKDEIDSRHLFERPPTTAAADGTATSEETTPAGVAAPAAGAPSTTSAPFTPEQARNRNLCDVTGQSVGKIADVRDNYVDVTAGPSEQARHIYVPFDAIDHCAGDCCYVNVTADQVDRMGWNQPPSPAQSGAAAGQPTGEIVVVEEEVIVVPPVDLRAPPAGETTEEPRRRQAGQ